MKVNCVMHIRCKGFLSYVQVASRQYKAILRGLLWRQNIRTNGERCRGISLSISLLSQPAQPAYYIYEYKCIKLDRLLSPLGGLATEREGEKKKEDINVSWRSYLTAF